MAGPHIESPSYLNLKPLFLNLTLYYYLALCPTFTWVSNRFRSSSDLRPGKVSMRHRQVSAYSSTDDSDPSDIESCFDTNPMDGNRRRNIHFSRRWAPHWILFSLSSTRRKLPHIPFRLHSFQFRLDLLHILQPAFDDRNVVISRKQDISLSNRADHVPYPGEPVVWHKKMPIVRH